MISVYSVLFTLVLFSELRSHSVTVAMPATKVEDGVTEQEGLGSILGDEPMAEPAVVPLPYRRGLVMDGSVTDEDGSPKILIISDTRLKRYSGHGLNPTFAWSLPVVTDQSFSHTPAEYNLKIDRRDTDLGMLRCMIGRVYRPCWKS